MVTQQSYKRHLIYNERTNIEKFQDCEYWMYSHNFTGDTAWIQCYRTEYAHDSIMLMLVADTMLTGESAKNRVNFSKEIQKARVPLILNGGMKVNTDSVILIETVISYFLKGIPVKIERFDAKDNKQSMITSVIMENKIIYKRYFTDVVSNFYKVDTVTFNADTTKIRRSSTRFEWKQTNVSEFQINGAILQVSFNDTMKREIENLDDKNIFSNILIDFLIYDDERYYMELRDFDRKKL